MKNSYCHAIYKFYLLDKIYWYPGSVKPEDYNNLPPVFQTDFSAEGIRKMLLERNRTLATITFQNFFRMYEKLSGMTGTADTEAIEQPNVSMMFSKAAVTNSLMDKISKKCHIKQKSSVPESTERTVDSLIERLDLIKQHI